MLLVTNMSLTSQLFDTEDECREASIKWIGKTWLFSNKKVLHMLWLCVVLHLSHIHFNGCNARHNPWAGVVPFLEEGSHALLILENPFKTRSSRIDGHLQVDIL